MVIRFRFEIELHVNLISKAFFEYICLMSIHELCHTDVLNIVVQYFRKLFRFSNYSNSTFIIVDSLQS